LSDFKEKKNVVLIFYADNGWRPCVQQLGGLQKRISEIEKLDAEVIAFATSGNQKDVKSTKRDLGITYTLIPTPNRNAVKDFGVPYGSGGAAYGTIILDKKGYIRFKSVDRWDSRTSPSRIIRELQGL
jgi:peroxiredoxin